MLRVADWTSTNECFCLQSTGSEPRWPISSQDLNPSPQPCTYRPCFARLRRHDIQQQFRTCASQHVAMPFVAASAAVPSAPRPSLARRCSGLIFKTHFSASARACWTAAAPEHAGAGAASRLGIVCGVGDVSFVCDVMYFALRHLPAARGLPAAAAAVFAGPPSTSRLTGHLWSVPTGCGAGQDCGGRKGQRRPGPSDASDSVDSPRARRIVPDAACKQPLVL